LTGPATIPIADSPEALTPSWLTTVLRKSEVLETGCVAAVSVSPIGTGQMCDCVRLELVYEVPTDAPRTIVAKLPASDETSRATARSLRTYVNEVRFYQELAPGLGVHTPRCYYADIDEESASFVLLLEDLAPARQGDQLEGCSVDEAHIAIDELVELHAPRWGDPALSRISWLHGDKAAGRLFLATFLPGMWEAFRTRYAGDLEEHVLEAGNILFGAIEEYLSAETGPATIVHGDYRLDNLLFDPTPGGVKISVVDWQMCTDGPALSDVAYFVGAGLLVDDRRAVETDLVCGYQDALIAAGVTGYTSDQCWRDYRRGTWAGLIMAVAASMLVERTARGDRMFLTMADRHARHALDLDGPGVLGA